MYFFCSRLAEVLLLSLVLNVMLVCRLTDVSGDAPLSVS